MTQANSHVPSCAIRFQKFDGTWEETVLSTNWLLLHPISHMEVPGSPAAARGRGAAVLGSRSFRRQVNAVERGGRRDAGRRL